MIDLCSYIARSKIISVCANSLGLNNNQNTENIDIILKFENGSIATINYYSKGSKKYSKERIEVHSSNNTWIIDDFCVSTHISSKGSKRLSNKLDKGIETQFKKYFSHISKGDKVIKSINSTEYFSNCLSLIASLTVFIIFE